MVCVSKIHEKCRQLKDDIYHFVPPNSLLSSNSFHRVMKLILEICTATFSLENDTFLTTSNLNIPKCHENILIIWHWKQLSSRC